MDRLIMSFFREANAECLHEEEKTSVRDTLRLFQQQFIPAGEYAVAAAQSSSCTY